MDAFESLLRKHRNSRFLVLDPEGGFGDQLILMGLEKKLQEMRIHYRLLRIRRSPSMNKPLARAMNSLPHLQGIIRAARPDILERGVRRLFAQHDEGPVFGLGRSEDVILLRGGAYLNDIWKDYGALRLVSKIAECMRATTVLISPQSFYFSTSQYAKPFASIKQVEHLFCRETESYNLLRSLQWPGNVHAHISPDTALYLTSSDFQIQTRRANYILIAPRLDRESVVRWRIRKIRRSSGKTIVTKDVNLLPNFKSYVETIANSSEVYTDRLHVAILAAILNKETYLLPNSYHKNKSAYGFSLKRFPNVNFIDTNEFPFRNHEKLRL